MVAADLRRPVQQHQQFTHGRHSQNTKFPQLLFPGAQGAKQEETKHSQRTLQQGCQTASQERIQGVGIL